MAPGTGGSPLLDIYGRVVGVATLAQAGEGRHVPIPVAWVNEARDVREPPVAPARERVPEEEPYKSPRPASRIPQKVEDIPPERREALEKAFRPPPKVPDDL